MAEKKDILNNIEDILTETSNWCRNNDIPMWSIEEARWHNFSKEYNASEFHIDYVNGEETNK